MSVGECDWLVPAAEEHGSTDDVQGKDRPREPEVVSVQPSHDLCAADAEQADVSGVDPQDGVRRLHLTQQVKIRH